MKPWTRGASRIVFSSGVNVVWFGNSLFFGFGSSVSTLPQKVAALPPIAGSGATASANPSVPGRSWAGMLTDVGTASAAWIPGKTNVLMMWEGTNSLYNDLVTPAQAVVDAQAVVAAARAANPWVTGVLTCIPRSGNRNAQRVAYDNLLRASYKSYGFDFLFDVAAKVPTLDFDGDVPANFVATQGYWSETSDWTHLNDAGYQLIANALAPELSKLPRRAR